MTIDSEVMRHLGRSVLATCMVVMCSSYTLMEQETASGAIRWGSVVTLFGAMYYLLVQMCVALYSRKRRRLRTRGGFDAFQRRYYHNNNSSSRYEQTETVASMDPHFDGSSSNDSTNNDPNFNDIDLPPIIEEEDVTLSQNVYYPELTMGSVWTYVYGWGILLFVCVYCASAIDVTCSCWWAMGMIVLSFDELISKGVENHWVILVALGLAASVFSLWSGSLVDKDGNMLPEAMFSSKSPVLLLDFIMGVVCPVAVPFIFFSVRSTVRAFTKDVGKLCEFAMPFMVVLSVFSLVATSGVCSYPPLARESYYSNTNNDYHHYSNYKTQQQIQRTRRPLENNNNNINGSVETMSMFASSYVSNMDNLDKASKLVRILGANHTLNYMLLFLSPFAALWLVRVLITAVLTGHCTEFITSFLLVVSLRHGATHDFSVWSAAAAGGVALVFILLLMVRRS